VLVVEAPLNLPALAPGTHLLKTHHRLEGLLLGEAIRQQWVLVLLKKVAAG
jgi:hypothetical protein